MEIFVAIVLFVIGFVLIIFGGNFFVDAAVRIAKRLKMSEILIGATIVSIGTTLPELLTSSMAAVKGSADLAAGNAIGSVICNTALIAGIVQAIRPSNFDYSDFRRGYIIFFVAVALFAVFAYSMGYINYVAGIIFIILFAFYLVFNVIMARRKQKMPENMPLYAENNSDSNADSSDSDKPDSDKTSGYAEFESKHKAAAMIIDIVILFATAAVLFFGTKLLIDNGIFLAEKLGVSEKLIAVIFIAIGTSLPELVTAISALVKKHSAVSLGNIIGANTLNLLMVVGVSSVITTLPMDKTWLMIDLPVMAAVSLILALPAIISKKMHRWQGFALLAVYVGYTAYTLIAG